MKTTIVSNLVSGLHDSPVVVMRNGFKNKSLSSFACNLFVGCSHGCRFCYVADTTTGRSSKLKSVLKFYGVEDPYRQWGDYVLVRPFLEKRFLASLEQAQVIPPDDLNPDGNRAIMFCSTTDPYMVVRDSNAERQKSLNRQARFIMRRSLEMILNHSDLNVRILTRSPLAREDFDLMKKFENRLMLGVSLPTLDQNLARVYEGRSPDPQQRLRLLRDARDEGIPVFAAVAPVFPEVGREGLLSVFEAIRDLEPHTVFMEPINRRKGISDRIRRNAELQGVVVRPEVFEDLDQWAPYAIGALRDAEELAKEAGLEAKLHLWPDTDLKLKKVLEKISDPLEHIRWLQRWWSRVSEWPGKVSSPWPE